MSYSLNEVDATVRKAARGSGLSWGLAEEAGKAARWLCAFGLPGAETAAKLLTMNDGAPYKELAPVEERGIWRAPGGRLCPVIAGATLSDRAADIAAGRSVEMREVTHPLLLLPFISRGASATGKGFTLRMGDQTVGCAPDGTVEISNTRFLLADELDGLICEASDQGGRFEGRSKSRSDESDAVWRTLTNLAHRTYAPATEESRIAGAGAGLVDTD